MPHRLTCAGRVRTIEAGRWESRRGAVRRRYGLACASVMAVAVVLAQTAGAAAPQRAGGPLTHGRAHVMAPIALRPQSFAVSGSGNLVYHGGPVMVGPTKSIAIFWHPAKLQSGAAASVSSAYDMTIRRYLRDVGGKGLYGNETQYSSIVNGSRLLTSYHDTSPYPASKCPNVFANATQRSNCLTDLQIQAEVRKAMTAVGQTGGLTEIFYVFLSKGEYTCIDSSACYLYPLDSSGDPLGYCAYHSFFTAGTRRVVYADMPYGDTPFSSKIGSFSSLCTALGSFPNDRSADIEISITSHEQLEAVTDPLLNAWWDAAGFEIGDKCAYDTTGSSLDGGLADERWAGHYYSVQTEYDNSTASCVPGGSFTPSPRTVARGSALTLTGSNYTPAATLTVSLIDAAGHVTALATTTASSSGDVGTPITIPAGAARGSARIRIAGPHASDGSSELVTLT
jgi:hypothetical protein